MSQKQVASVKSFYVRPPAEADLWQSETFSRVILNSLAAQIAVLDKDGTILAVNEAWQHFAGDNGADMATQMGVGVNYLAVCRRAVGEDAGEAQAALAGIQAVLTGSQPSFSLEYPCHSPTAKSWFLLHVIPLSNEQAGAIVFHTNITERKQMELNLRELEHHYRQLFEGLGDMVVVYSGQGRFLDCNEVTLQRLGYSRAELLSLRVTDIVHPDFYPAMRDNQQKLWAGETTVVESAYCHKNGIMIPVEVNARRINYLGDVAILAVIRDITKRKQIEEALRESEQKYRELVENANSIILRLDHQGRITFFNEFAQQFFGYTAAEIVGQPAVGTIVPATDSTGRDLRGLIKAIGQEPEKYSYNENENMRRNGQRVWVSWTNKAIRNEAGRLVEILCIGSDITERKRVEEQLRESHQFIQNVADTSPHLIYIYDLAEQGNVYLNDRASTVLGYSPAQIKKIGSRLLAKLIHPADYEAVVAHFSKLASDTTGAIFENEYRIIHANGEERWLRSRDVAFARNDLGVPQQVLGTAEDITERRQTELEKERLFQAVSQQREQLRILTRQLAEAQEVERKQLAQELHDQVGQNLTGLGLNLNIIRAQLAKMPPETGSIQARLEDSVALVDQIAEQVRDVMVHLRPPVLDDYGLLAALRWYGARFAERAGLMVTVQGEELTPRLVPLVENALFRIAQEALTNVIKHAQANEVTVTIEMDNGNVRLVVADDGCGFDLTCLADPVGSHGWGIPTMTERAEAVGAWFRIESKPGQGTQIIVEVTPLEVVNS